MNAETVMSNSAMQTAVDFEHALASTRGLRYGIGAAGAVFGGLSGYMFALAIPHVSLTATIAYIGISSSVYGFALYGASTLAVEFNAVSEANNRKLAEQIVGGMSAEKPKEEEVIILKAEDNGQPAPA